MSSADFRCKWSIQQDDVPSWRCQNNMQADVENK
jgi:hypothetical protein